MLNSQTSTMCDTYREGGTDVKDTLGSAPSKKLSRDIQE